MAVPSLPSALNAGDVVSNAWVDAVRAQQAWFRDDRPIFKGQAFLDADPVDPSADVLTATTTTFGFGDAGAFGDTPIINVGGWTTAAAGDQNPESLVVPEAGIYHLNYHAVWASNSTGYRQISVRVNGSGPAGGGLIGSAEVASWQGSSVVLDLAANDELDLQVYQTSGSTLTCNAYLTAIWMQST